MKKSISNMESIKRFYDWMDSTKKATIVKFKLNADHVFDYMDQRDKWDFKWHNAHYESYTAAIDAFLKIDKQVLQDYVDGKFARGDGLFKCYAESDTVGYDLYRIIKCMWLYESIKNDCQHAPIQLHKNVNGYRFHPGSDKINALYLLSRIYEKDMNSFYIWYKDLDDDFENRVDSYELVNTPQEFANMFVKFDNDSFNIIENSFQVNGLDFTCNESHFDVFGEYFMDTLEAQHKNLNLDLRHISYNDNIHHKGIDLEIELIQSFKLSEDGETFTFPNGLKFIKRYTTTDWWEYHWVPECDGNDKF